MSSMKVSRISVNDVLARQQAANGDQKSSTVKT